MIPRTCKKLVAVSLSTHFRDCVQVKVTETPRPGPDEVLIRNRYVGINASDINFTAGKYIAGITPPFDTGFEAIGEVVSLGANCNNVQLGTPVGFMQYGAFSEYIAVPSKRIIPLPSLRPEFVPLLVSGSTASISLELMGKLKPGEKVLVTAAAGGTGQFAVQLAKLAGCHVIGTCSTDSKVEFLKKLGCDRPVNYKRENLATVLKEEYAGGVDVVYESVGGDMINTCIKNLAIGGRLIVIGFVSGYQEPSSFATRPTLPLYQILLQKSASISGFFLNNHSRIVPKHVAKLSELCIANKLHSCVDMGFQSSKGNSFKGINSVFDAVDYLYSSQSIGKVIVDLQEESKL